MSTPAPLTGAAPTTGFSYRLGDLVSNIGALIALVSLALPFESDQYGHLTILHVDFLPPLLAVIVGVAASVVGTVFGARSTPLLAKPGLTANGIASLAAVLAVLFYAAGLITYGQGPDLASTGPVLGVVGLIVIAAGCVGVAFSGAGAGLAKKLGGSGAPKSVQPNFNQFAPGGPPAGAFAYGQPQGQPGFGQQTPQGFSAAPGFGQQTPQGFAPAPGFGQPAQQGFSQPAAQGFDQQPAQGFGPGQPQPFSAQAPAQGFAQPAPQGFTPPAQEFAQPDSPGVNLPDQGFAPPAQGFGPPDGFAKQSEPNPAGQPASFGETPSGFAAQTGAPAAEATPFATAQDAPPVTAEPSAASADAAYDAAPPTLMGRSDDTIAGLGGSAPEPAKPAQAATFTPYWAGVTATIPAFSPAEATNQVGEVTPGQWYLVTGQHPAGLLIDLRGRPVLVRDTNALVRG